MAKMGGSPAGIEMLRESVKAAQMEFDVAVTFHETWKPAAYDEDLHIRMGTSYATQTFRVIRTALRREMVLALMRIWDRSKGTLRMEEMARAVRTEEVMKALASERAKNMGWPSTEPDIRKTLNLLALQVTGTVAKYAPGTPGYPLLEDLRTLRNEQLAHHNLSFGATEGVSIADADIETFYQDNLVIVKALLHLVNAHAYNPAETAGVYRHYAGHFWAGVRGEQTEGHPNYRARRPLPPD